MTKDHDGSGGSGGGTLKVTDEYLRDVALNQISNFIENLRGSDVVARVNAFAAGAGSGLGAGPGDYSKLMPGAGQLASASQLQSRFQSLCAGLQAELHSLDATMTGISVDLQMAQAKLNNGADEALSAAQMMQVLQDAYGGGPSAGATKGLPGGLPGGPSGTGATATSGSSGGTTTPQPDNKPPSGGTSR